MLACVNCSGLSQTWHLQYLRVKINNGCFRLFYSAMVHAGTLIKEELRRQERSVARVRKLCCERTNVYSIFKRKSIDTALLLRISCILHHNFFQYYCEELPDGRDFSSTKP